MAKLVYIRPAGTKGYLALTLLSGQTAVKRVVPEGVYEEIGAPMRGEELPPETMQILEDESAHYFAVKKALDLLSYADNSEKQLTEKLMRHGFSRKAAEDATREAVSLGYLNEERQLSDAILREAKTKLHGPHRIVRDLCAKGYRKDRIVQTIGELTDGGDLDFPALFKTLLQKKKVPETDENAVRKWRYTYGFDKGDEI